MISLASWNLEGGYLLGAGLPDTLQYGLARATNQDVGVVVILVLLFCLSYSLQPWAVSKYLYSRGSSPHLWKNRPLIIAFIPFFVDALYLNTRITKFQILMALMCGLCYVETRSG